MCIYTYTYVRIRAYIYIYVYNWCRVAKLQGVVVGVNTAILSTSGSIPRSAGFKLRLLRGLMLEFYIGFSIYTDIHVYIYTCPYIYTHLDGILIEGVLGFMQGVWTATQMQCRA